MAVKNEYLQFKKVFSLPRVPLKGTIDLTYRCNNNCRHCWLRIPFDSPKRGEELALEEIKFIVSQARKMGCHKWLISGGEPMIREDFFEILEYITANAGSYAINTNGTFITPKIAKLLKKQGSKMIALYGATEKVHDHITRNPGSFEAAMRGFRYLKEAGTGFTVQIVPMRDNYHQFSQMIALAESLSRHYRIGAAWFYLSASRDAVINKEIARQRLAPKEVVSLDKPDISYQDSVQKDPAHDYRVNGNGYLFSSCIASRRDFHVDPYGFMSFCGFLKHPEMRYDLRKGSFCECWEEFIPSLAVKVKIAEDSNKNCQTCKLRSDCRFCPVYGYLEHNDFNAKVEYLCSVAKENRKYKQQWKKNHRRFYKIAGMAIKVESDLPITRKTFNEKFKHFEAKNPNADVISIRHHFSLPDLTEKNLGQEVYRKAPWAVYKNNDSWIYLGISSVQEDQSLHRVVVFNNDHTRARIYNKNENIFLKGNLHSLTLFPTDQILIARVLADRNGCYIHSCGVKLNGHGLLFAGHSEAGKSTMAAMLKGKAEILCDDRIIVRKARNDFQIYGTWSHGDIPDISAGSAPLKAVMFLKKSNRNQIIPLEDKREIAARILTCIVRPFVTMDWWHKTFLLADKIIAEIPCYTLEFDKSGKIVELLERRFCCEKMDTT
jgi:MoaA/NifB/PqqE/SkfB family radical SAM enzyme